MSHAQFPDDDSLPFRLRQSTFRVYEPFIAQAIAEAPATVNINPAPLRPTTFAARLRDAIISYDKFRWPASFTSLDFDAAYKTRGLAVSHSEFAVVLGPRKLLKGSNKAGASLAFLNPNNKRIDGIFIKRELADHEIHAFCVLLAGKLISGPVILEATKLDSDRRNSLESNYDIAITENEKGHVIII